MTSSIEIKLQDDEPPQQVAIENSNIRLGSTEDPVGGDKKSEMLSESEKVIEVDYNELVKSLKLTGQMLRSDLEQPKLSEKPVWFNKELFQNGQSVYGRHFMGVNFAHLSGLLLLIRVDSIYDTLSRTGESSKVSKLFRRYYNTIKHVKCWYEGDIFEEHSEAYRSLLIVRGMHNKVSSNFNNKTDPKQHSQETAGSEVAETTELLRKEPEEERVHISQYDIMLTQFAFIGFIVTNANKMGLLSDYSQRDMDSLIHFWRVIGYYLGASDKYNLCSYDFETISKLCHTMMNLEYRESLTRNKLNESSPGIMSLNVVRSLKFVPMITVYGVMRYLYEIFEYDTDELERRRTWYSNLSYTFLKLVMTNLLAYRPLRAFNNGLTRLSLHLIGRIEDWFSDHLDSKYGHELKI